MLDTIINIILELAIPWAVLILNVLHIPRTVKQIVVAGEYFKLVSPSDFKSQWFANFWATIGPEVKESYRPHVEALLQGRFKDGRIHDDVVCEPISGVVLEVGAGNGAWMDVLAGSVHVDSAPRGAISRVASGVNRRAADGQTASLGSTPSAYARPEGQITKIYGIEPNPSFITPLRKRVRELHLGGIYQVIPAGIDELISPDRRRDSIPEGSIDSIVCICCLCSIPNPEENIKILYRLLKPGGRWYIHEHVKASRGGLLLRAYQCKSTFPLAAHTFEQWAMGMTI
ncbi:hypothetical protein NQ176_g3712 [Zarea fungicola]|uniref:Uncharacterized protein n=1 Tax=Zarea fungicola TaxID=93591 RepID=A0ACC1NH62_9HYPO|nr:hypothetical protein NQ176_g3712 [Lecanicillium fungicola]